MDYNIFSNLQYCKEIVDGFQNLLLYSHIPSAFIALFLGLFVYLKNKELLLSKILLAISLLFGLWSFFDLVIWLGYDRASLVMFAWMPSELFAVPMFMLCLYFAYVFIYKKDLTTPYKFLIGLPILPILLAAPTHLNIAWYDIQECIATENNFYTNYVLWVKIFYAVITLVVILFALVKEKSWKGRSRIGILAVGILVFLYSFLISGYISEVTSNYSIEIYGLFGMIAFIGSLSYLIVRFSEFNVKVISVQALVIVLNILIASQFFFVQTAVNQTLVVATVVLSVIFGFYLIRSVRKEIEARGKIEKLAGDLKKANTRLLELDKQKSEFVSFATHQLRAPLTAMKGYTSLILEGEMGDITAQVREAVGRIYDSSKTLTNIVDDYLNISRIELGTMKYSFEVLNLKDLVESVIGELKPNIDRSGLAFAFAQTPADPRERFMVHADKDKLKQVVANMIDNSIKYTPKGSLEVALLKSTSDRKIVFSVKDTGVGIAPAVMPKLFQKFIRAESANKQNIYGTGLGLFVAKEIVTSHKGRIWAESDGEGKGSTFYLELEMAV